MKNNIFFKNYFSVCKLIFVGTTVFRVKPLLVRNGTALQMVFVDSVKKEIFKS